MQSIPLVDSSEFTDQMKGRTRPEQLDPERLRWQDLRDQKIDEDEAYAHNDGLEYHSPAKHHLLDG